MSFFHNIREEDLDAVDNCFLVGHADSRFRSGLMENAVKGCLGG